MPAGAAYKRLRPASIEINTQISSVSVCAPLAPPNARPARSIKVSHLSRRYQHDLSVEHDGLQGGDQRPHGGKAGCQAKQLKRQEPL